MEWRTTNRPGYLMEGVSAFVGENFLVAYVPKAKEGRRWQLWWEGGYLASFATLAEAQACAEQEEAMLQEEHEYALAEANREKNGKG